MRNLFNISLLAVLSCVMISCGGGSKITDPVEYNNKFMTIMNLMQADMVSMNEAMIEEDYSKAEEARKAWETKIDTSLEEVKAIGDFKGDASFQEAVLSALNDYKGLVADDYKKLIDLRTAQKDKEDTPESDKADTDLLEKINATLAKAANGLNDASDKFEKSL